MRASAAIVVALGVLLALAANRVVHGASAWTPRSVSASKSGAYLVTGANAGLGLATAKLLLARGAGRVIITARSPRKGALALELLRGLASPGQRVDLELLELADLQSVAQLVGRLGDTQLEAAVLNAGVMVPPYSATKQGFELQFGVNHLGHFALAVPLAKRRSVKRIVVVSSSAADVVSPVLGGKFDYDKFVHVSEEDYAASIGSALDGALSYGVSKMANLHFARGLSQRFPDLEVAATHPGWTSTELQRHSWLQVLNHVFAMGTDWGAWSQVRATLEPTPLPSTEYWFGPAGAMQVRGNPAVLRMPGAVHNQKEVDRLWDLSEELTGVRM